MTYRAVLTSGPSAEPVTLAQAKEQTQYTHTNAQDDLLTRFITAARALVESKTNLCLITKTYELHLSHFPGVIYLPHPPLQQVDSITYIDADDVEQTVEPSVYQSGKYTRPGRIITASQQSWPTDVKPGTLEAVKVTYKAGFGNTAADVPEELKHAILLIVAEWFEHRKGLTTGTIVSELPHAVAALVEAYRVHPV